MLHDNRPQRETVPVEAGLVADVDSGKVRSETMAAHYNMLEQSMSERRAKKHRRARIAKIAWLSFSLALPAGGAVFYFNSDESQNASFDGQISDFTDGERTGIERERERDLRERFGPVKSAEDLQRTRTE